MKKTVPTDANYDQVREHLLEGEDAAERGRIDGQRLLPQKLTTQPSEFEATIIERANRKAAAAMEKCQGAVASNLEAWRSKAAPDPIRKIDDARLGHEAALGASAAEWNVTLGRLADTLRLARRQTEAVIGATETQPPARGWPNWIDFIFLFVIMASAEISCAWLLLRDALGLYDGVIMAVIFTLGSVALGGAAGVGALRKRNGAKPGPLETIRRQLTPISLLLMGALHYVLAQWRALGLEGRDLSELPQRFINAPFSPFLHYETWILAILAAVVFGAFAFKVFEAFGGAVDLRKVDRARIKAEESWEAGKQDYQDALGEAGDDACDDIQAAVDEAEAWSRSAATFSEEILGLVFSANRLIEVTQDAAASVSNTYRAANSSCRDDGGPAIWARPVQIELRQVTHPEAAHGIAVRFEQLAKQAKEHARGAITAVRAREKLAVEGLDAFFTAAAANHQHVEPFNPYRKAS